jgi:cytoskeletal protein CcmA (bactofilin family)
MLSSFGNKKSDKDVASEPARPGTQPAMAAGGPPPLAARPVVNPRPGERTAASIIGPDLTIIGNLVSRGEVQVDGEVQGDLHGTNIVIGERARITGTVIAEEIIVRGHIMGSVRGRRVMLQSSSHVEGDIYHSSLAIEQGAFFEGKSRRSEDPISGAGKPEAASTGQGAGPIPLPAQN